MRDAHRMKEKYDLSLDNRQIVSLLIAALVVLGSVFVLGVVVGKTLSGEDGVTQAPDLLTALDAKARQRASALEEDELDVAPLTFPDTLTERRAPTPPRSEPIAAAIKPDAAKVAADKAAAEKLLAEKTAAEKLLAEKAAADKTSAEKLLAEKTAAEKLQSEKAAAEKLLAEKTAAEKAAAEKALAAKSPAEELPARVAAVAKSPAAETTATRTAPNASLGDAFERAASPSGTAGKGAFTLQLSASQNPTEAEAFAQRLRSRGYAPYVVSGEVPDRGTFYRVRMGSFPTREAAQTYLADFKRETQLDGFIAAN